MSQAALLRATLHTLRSSVPGLTVNNSKVSYDAQPPAYSAAETYLCIYPHMWHPGPSPDLHEGIEDVYGITLAINRRTSLIPRDRWGEDVYLNESRSIEVASRQLRSAMHAQRYSLLTLANQYAGIDTNLGVEIFEPLMFQEAPTPPIPMDASWWGGDPEEELPYVPDGRRIDKSGQRQVLSHTAGSPDALQFHGLLMELRYEGGRRLQKSEILEHFVAVGFLATEDTQPAITGTYRGSPDSITVTIQGQPYAPSFSNGTWSLPGGTVTLGPGVYDITAVAVYNGGEVSVNELTTDEVTILDPNTIWAWSDGSLHVWSDGQQAGWTGA